MAVVTEVKVINQSLTNEASIRYAQLTVTSDETYTPTAITGKTIKVLSCYNNTDGATVKVTQSAGVLTMGNGQTLSDEDTMLCWTYV